MNAVYQLRDPSAQFTPALLFYKDLIRRNIAEAVRLAGVPERLRPHVKTHKTGEIVRLELAAGITKHKCATLAEAEMLAGCGVPDVLLAYPMVGPNCQRLTRLVAMYPRCSFAVLGDHPASLKALSDELSAARQSVEVLLDLNVGQDRTGIPPGEEAVRLYQLLDRLPGLRPGGLHVYDGHNHQESRDERAAAVERLLGPVHDLRRKLEGQRLPVPRLVCGGTPTFPVFARMDFPGLELSPGTCVLNDHGYGTKFTDLNGFTPAALLLTRLISKPTPTRLTLDLGTKAVASDPPAGKRCTLLNLEEYQPVVHNEEHFVVETPAAERYQPGDVFYVMPTHICPTCALHKEAYVVEDGVVTERWEIVARDRVLSV